MPVLILLFFITAVLYAAVGFGGGSTYNALLVLHGADYRILPSIALICNIIVVAGGALRFSRAGSLDWRALAPWIAASVPATTLPSRFWWARTSQHIPSYTNYWRDKSRPTRRSCMLLSVHLAASKDSAASQRDTINPSETPSPPYSLPQPYVIGYMSQP